MTTQDGDSLSNLYLRHFEIYAGLQAFRKDSYARFWAFRQGRNAMQAGGSFPDIWELI